MAQKEVVLAQILPEFARILPEFTRIRYICMGGGGGGGVSYNNVQNVLSIKNVMLTLYACMLTISYTNKHLYNIIL